MFCEIKSRVQISRVLTLSSILFLFILRWYISGRNEDLSIFIHCYLDREPSATSQKGLPIPSPIEQGNSLFSIPVVWRGSCARQPCSTSCSAPGSKTQTSCGTPCHLFRWGLHGPPIVNLRRSHPWHHLLDHEEHQPAKDPDRLWLFPLHAGFFSPLSPTSTPAWRGFICWASSFCSRHLIKGKLAFWDTLMSLSWP